MQILSHWLLGTVQHLVEKKQFICDSYFLKQFHFSIEVKQISKMEQWQGALQEVFLA